VHSLSGAATATGKVPRLTNQVYAIVTLTFSGTIRPSGDTLDFHANCGQIAVHANGPSFRRVAERQQRLLHSGAGNCAEYNRKLKAFAGGGTEITAGQRHH
jgi:hypothetical protein